MQNGATQQIAQGCRTVANSIVVGLGDGSANQIKKDPTFVDAASFDLHLVPGDASNQQFIIDKAVEVNASDKNSDHDYDGAPRPQGAGHDIGAYEAPAAM